MIFLGWKAFWQSGYFSCIGSYENFINKYQHFKGQSVCLSCIFVYEGIHETVVMAVPSANFIYDSANKHTVVHRNLMLSETRGGV